MRQLFLSLIVVSIITFGQPSSAVALQRNRGEQLTAEKVRESIDRGVQFLMRQIRPGRGEVTWGKVQAPEDVTALCVLALLNAEVPPDNEKMQRALEQIESVPVGQQSTYFTSLRIMAFAAADPDGKRYMRQISRDVQWLIQRQVQRGAGVGGWCYTTPNRTPDASNSQFALLALHEAAKIGVDIPQTTWKAAAKYWTATNTKDGGFSYLPRSGGSTGSMTCAGISSWIIIEENLAAQNGKVRGDTANCCGDNGQLPRIEKAIAWLAERFKVRENPGRRSSQLYYLYGMERAGRLAGRRFFGAHDWYRAGAEVLLQKQNKLAGYWRGNGHGEANENVGTALALLFLAKGKRPIAIGKAKWAEGDRWDQHPKGVHLLTRRLEKDWKQRLNWQTVRTKNATVDDLLEAPVLFFSGREALQLDATEKENLRAYLENGGFVFAEACQGEGCGDAAFDDAFRSLMAEVLPDSQLEPLPPDHPIWGAHYPLVPDRERPLLAMQSCCRTSVVYCPANLSCYWALDRPTLEASPRLRARVENCIRIGVNVVTYATGRELQEKGDTPKITDQPDDLLAGRVLVLPKLMHGGGSDDAPNAWRNVLRDVSDSDVAPRIETEKTLIQADLESLSNYAFVFMHGRSQFQFTDDQRQALRTYLEVGGVLFADSICSTPAFTKAFRREIKQITGETLAPIPANHPIWQDRRFGDQIDRVTLRTRDLNARDGFREQKVAPQLEGLEIDGELRVIFSPYDLSCAMENTSVSQCDGYTREDASRIATQVILYRLLSD